MPYEHIITQVFQNRFRDVAGSTEEQAQTIQVIDHIIDSHMIWTARLQFAHDDPWGQDVRHFSRNTMAQIRANPALSASITARAHIRLNTGFAKNAYRGTNGGELAHTSEVRWLDTLGLKQHGPKDEYLRAIERSLNPPKVLTRRRTLGTIREETMTQVSRTTGRHTENHKTVDLSAMLDAYKRAKEIQQQEAQGTLAVPTENTPLFFSVKYLPKRHPPKDTHQADQA